MAKLILGRCRGLVEVPRRPCSNTRETDKDGAEANGYFNTYQTRGKGFRPFRIRQGHRSLPVVFPSLELELHRVSYTKVPMKCFIMEDFLL